MGLLTHGHPYVPRSIELPDWQPPAIPFDRVLAQFFAAVGVVLVGMALVVGRAKHLKTTEKLVAAWFMVSGLIHFVVEGTVVVNPKFYASTSGNLLNEIWKEYANADSRYATRDAFVICMEAVTAFAEGPGCFLAVYGLLTRARWRHAPQILVSAGQFYGDVLYFATTAYEGLIHCRPEPLYYYGYFILANAVWLVVPALVVIGAFREIAAAVAAADRLAGGRTKRQ